MASGATSTSYELQSYDGTVESRDVELRDVESRNTITYISESDPHRLRSKLKTEKEIEEIIKKIREERSREGLPKNSKGLRGLRKFYRHQNEQIERLLKTVADHVQSAEDVHDSNQTKYAIARNGSLAANIILAGLQIYASATSGSLSLITTMADAIFDPLSNITLIICRRAIKRVDDHKFPSGKARIETAGNIVFCGMMTTVSLILIVVSILQIVERRNDDEDSDMTTTFHFASIIAVAVALATKFTLFLYCWALRNKYSQIRMLWEDHRNDLFVNGFGLLTSIGGSKLAWWVDPMGAIILSCILAILWPKRAYHEFQLLIGITADPYTHQLFTNLGERRLWKFGTSFPPI